MFTPRQQMKTQLTHGVLLELELVFVQNHTCMISPVLELLHHMVQPYEANEGRLAKMKLQLYNSSFLSARVLMGG
jgi:hypothetical protein